MKNTKKIIISLIIALAIFISIEIILNNFLKVDRYKIYIAKSDIYEGEKIEKNNVQMLEIEGKNLNKEMLNVDMIDKVAAKNISEGKIILNSDIQNKGNLEKLNNYEYVAIELKNISDSFAYQINKGDNVNIYYTVKDKSVSSIIAGKEVISNISDSKTIKIFENVKVMGKYDSVGNEVSNNEQYSAVIIRATKEEAMIVSNIKSEGTFSISLSK